MDTQSSQPVSQHTIEGQPQKSHKKLIAAIIVVVIVLIAAGAAAYCYFNQPKQVACTMEAKLCPDGSSVGRTGPNCEFAPCPQNLTADWKTYKNEEYGFSIDLPSKLYDAIDINPNPIHSGAQNIISIKTLEEIKKEYETMGKEGGCPGQCDSFAHDISLLDKQFEYLSKSADCQYTESSQGELSKNFKLFYFSIGSHTLLTGLKNNNLGQCGIRSIDYDSNDVSLDNYLYRAGFLKDNKIIEFQFTLLPKNTFPEADKIWKNHGFDFNAWTWTCGNECNMRLNSLDDPLIQTIINRYDKIVSTFKFTK